MSLFPVFCYGSNNPDQLSERIGHRPKMEGAYLEGYQRIFVGYSQKWQGGVGSLKKAPGKQVYGLVAYLSSEDIQKLDRFEGWHPDNVSGSTIKKYLKVTTQQGKKITVLVYLGTATDRNPPSQAYREAIAKTISAFWSGSDGSAVTWQDISFRRNPEYPWLNEDLKTEIRQFEKSCIHKSGGFLEVCEEVNYWLERRLKELGADTPQIEDGVYAGPGFEDSQKHPNPPGYWHFWVRLKDGTILDAATSQFDIEPPVVIPPLDPRQAWYLPGTSKEDPSGYYYVEKSIWTPKNNPSKYVFGWHCPSPPNISNWQNRSQEDLSNYRDMVEYIHKYAEAIDYQEFEQAVGGEQKILDALMYKNIYDEWLKIKDDFTVSWYKSKYPDGTPIFFYVHSGVEHVFEPSSKRNPLEVSDLQRRVRLNNMITFVVRMDPEDFIRLAEAPEGQYPTREHLLLPDNEQVKPLEIFNQFTREGEIYNAPYLEVEIDKKDPSKGKVMGHEGRHRMGSLIKNGDKVVEVGIKLRRGGYPIKDGSFMDCPTLWTAQFRRRKLDAREFILDVTEANLQVAHQKAPKIKNVALSHSQVVQILNQKLAKNPNHGYSPTPKFGKVVCAICDVFIRGDKKGPVVSHGYCKQRNPKKKLKKLKNEAPWFEVLLNQPFYRGLDATGRGTGHAFMGEGLYTTWHKPAAQGFSILAVNKSGKGPGKLISYQLKPGVKLLDNFSPKMLKIKKDLGVGPWDKIETPLFAKALTLEVKEAGYDGVISDDPYFGMVVFDPQNLIKIKEEIYE